MSESRTDIYNFIVGGDGSIYEGRGWNNQPEVLKEWNNNSLSILLLGTFNGEDPPTAQLNGTQKLIDEGIKINKIVPAYDLYSLCQLSTDFSDCSFGSCLRRAIKKLPRWSDKVTSDTFKMIYNSNRTDEDMICKHN